MTTHGPVGRRPGPLSPEPSGPRPVDAVVLAGGSSRRMGTDKAALVVDGEVLVQRVVRRLRPLGGRVLLARGPRPPLPGPWAGPAPLVVADADGVDGPLAGLLGGLEAAVSDVVAVVAVDHADVDVDVLARAARHLRDAQGRLDVVVPARRAWLHAVWCRAAASRVREVLADGGTTAVGAVVGRLRTHVLRGLDGPWRLDLDTVADVAARHERTPPRPA